MNESIQVLNGINQNIEQLLKHQRISNLLAISVNPNAPEEVRREAFAQAMVLQDFSLNLSGNRNPQDDLLATYQGMDMPANEQEERLGNVL